jgi:hypothetical protein
MEVFVTVSCGNWLFSIFRRIGRIAFSPGSSAAISQFHSLTVPLTVFAGTFGLVLGLEEVLLELPQAESNPRHIATMSNAANRALALRQSGREASREPSALF